MSETLLGLREAYGDTLARLGETNSKIVVLDADLSSSTRTSRFREKFPDRFFNMGVAEQDLIATAAGMAIGGKIPFASTFAVFETGRAWEQIRQAICYPKINVKLVSSHGGLTVGEDGATHQSLEDIALMRILPNMTVIVPADACETIKVIETIVLHNGPVYVRTSRNKYPVIFNDDYRFEIGKSTTLRDGDKATIIAVGLMVHNALKAAQLLEAKGISVRVINMSTIKPIDKQAIIKSAQETKAIVTVEEHSIIGGLGSAVAEVLVEHYPILMARLGTCDMFGTSGLPDELIKKYGLTAEDIVLKVEEIVGKKSVRL
ncbi:MAG: transketolase family protein [bacterium]